jgi:hypothetical protein
MHLNVFQQKILFVPFKSGHQNSLFVVIGLKNVLKHGGKVGIGNQPCILHLEPGKGHLHQDCIFDLAGKSCDLMNTLWGSKQGADIDKVANPFSTRLLPLRQPKSE